MPSEAAAPALPSARAPRLAWLRSQGLGVLCGQLTVLLLGAGSVVIVSTRDGASEHVRFDDINAFFQPVRWEHAWFYALLGVLALYALNTALCTWDSVVQKLATKVREPSAWAPALMHVSFLLALLAHLVGGLWTVDHAPVVVGRDWAQVGPGQQARVTALAQEHLSDGRPKSVQATVELRDGSGAVRTETLGYNEPLTWDLGRELLLLEQAGQHPRTGENAVLARGRTVPGNPWALASAVVMTLGLVLMGRRWL